MNEPIKCPNCGSERKKEEVKIYDGVRCVDCGVLIPRNMEDKNEE